jgi:hypothetical protein
MSRRSRSAAQNSCFDGQRGLFMGYRPKSPDASPEQLRRLTGVIALTEHLPPVDLFDDEVNQQPAEHARD